MITTKIEKIEQSKLQSVKGSLSKTMANFLGSDSNTMADPAVNGVRYGYVEINVQHEIETVVATVLSAQNVFLVQVYPKLRLHGQTDNNWFTVKIGWYENSGFNSVQINYTYTYTACVLNNYTNMVVEPVTIEQRLDRELDSGSFDFIKRDVNSTDEIDAPLSHYRVTFSDGASEMTADYIGKDTRTLLRGKYGDGSMQDAAAMFRHGLLLTESTKLLEGLLIDGFAVTQPEEISSRQSLYEVVDRLLETIPLIKSADDVYYVPTLCDGQVVSSTKVDTLYRNTVRNEYIIPYKVTSADVSLPAYSAENVKITIGSYHGVVDGESVVGSLVNASFDFYSTTQIVSVEYILTVQVLPSDTIQSIDQLYAITDDSKIVSLLKNTTAPQFKWGTQTTLWECLCDVGSAIDAIPRLVADVTGEYNLITFDLINETIDEVDDLLDNYARDYGEEVDDSQYNSQLRSVVENVKEE